MGEHFLFKKLQVVTQPLQTMAPDVHMMLLLGTDWAWGKGIKEI
jgi:hypothetical protein